MIIREEFTAGAYITTDKSDNQIAGFNPGAMKQATDYDVSSADPNSSIMLLAPGNLSDDQYTIAESDSHLRKQCGRSMQTDPGGAG